MSDIVETLKSITATKGRDHRSGKEFILLDDTQAVVDAIVTAHDEITRLRRELAEARNVALEEAAFLLETKAAYFSALPHQSTRHIEIQHRYRADTAAIRSLKEKAE